VLMFNCCVPAVYTDTFHAMVAGPSTDPACHHTYFWQYEIQRIRDIACLSGGVGIYLPRKSALRLRCCGNLYIDLFTVFVVNERFCSTAGQGCNSFLRAELISETEYQLAIFQRLHDWSNRELDDTIHLIEWIIRRAGTTSGGPFTSAEDVRAAQENTKTVTVLARSLRKKLFKGVFATVC
jgi:hypothetical protein